MTELRHLQLVILMIAKDIDSICKKYNIFYSLSGGTALGAIRHQGFIPWDDDLDLLMDFQNYNRFIEVARKEFNNDKYYFEEGLADWPMDYCKVKLKNTKMDEAEGYGGKHNQQGIFVDVFRLDTAAPTKLGRMWQYACTKFNLAYQLHLRGYDSAGALKKAVMKVSTIQKISFLRAYFSKQRTKYNHMPTSRQTQVFSPECTSYSKSFYPISLVKDGSSYVEFEDTTLPVYNHIKLYLSIAYGDYMKLPPESERVGLHHDKVDFGPY